MNIFTSVYHAETGWQTHLPADLDSPQTLILIFADPALELYQTALVDIQEVYPNSVITGCSTYASILNDGIIENGLVINIIQFKHSQVQRAFTQLNDSDDSYAAGKRIAQQLDAPDLTAVILLTDGVYTRGTELAAGISQSLNPNVNIAGGLASDKATFRKNWLLNGTSKVPRSVAGIGFYGPHVRVHTAAKDGWHPFGPERTVTKAQGNALYELDNFPAFELYQKYLGKRSSELEHSPLNFPLAIWQKNRKHYIIRAVLEVNEENNSLRCAGELTEGSRAQLMYANSENLIDGAEEAVTSICQQLPENPPPVFALAISCYGRKVVMGEDTEQELEAIMEHLPAGSAQSGFYSYGELARNEELNTCSLYNETMTLTLIYEMP